MKPVMFLSLFLIIVLIINLVLLALGIMTSLWFFIVVIVIGLIAFKGIPYIKKK